MYRNTWIEISKSNLKHNITTLLRTYPGYRYYFGVVKGNAYGHGFDIVKTLVEAGINYLAVSSLEEALAVRKETPTPVLCLQPIHIEEIPVAIEHDITITVSSYEFFQKLIALPLQQPLKVHLKINSGFNRLGISTKEHVKDIVTSIKRQPFIRLEGIYSHFATTGVNDSFLDDQVTTFKDLTSVINLEEIPIVHLDRSFTLANNPKIPFCTGVRIGMLMYGYYRSPLSHLTLRSIFRGIKHQLTSSQTGPSPLSTLRPALSLWSEVIETRKVKAGEHIGYGASFQAESDCRVGILSIGYSDGFSKKNKGGFVTVDGKSCLIVAVDMCMTTILIDKVVKTGDKAELIGAKTPMAEVARRAGSSIYETLCALKETLPRFLA